MSTPSKKQILYCFVDETGQDDRSEYFIVVAIVSSGDQQELKESLIRIEQQSKIGAKKWHKLRSPERETFLDLVVQAKLGAGQVFFGKYQRPLPFFEPMVETLSRAIQLLAAENHRAVVYVDGIDRKKAGELTRALREKGIKTELVRSARDESEPLIRLADRWAGCIRGGFEGQDAAGSLVGYAIEVKYLTEV
jgi:hypothetical protein